MCACVSSPCESSRVAKKQTNSTPVAHCFLVLKHQVRQWSQSRLIRLQRVRLCQVHQGPPRLLVLPHRTGLDDEELQQAEHEVVLAVLGPPGRVLLPGLSSER